MAAGYPAAPFEPKGSRAMAIVALILALVICIPFLPALVAIVLAVVVLVAKKPGKGLAITAIVISLLASAAWIGLFAAIGSGEFDYVFDDLLPVEHSPPASASTRTTSPTTPRTSSRTSRR